MLHTVVPIGQTGELVALKKIPLRKLEDGIPNSALRYNQKFIRGWLYNGSCVDDQKGDEGSPGM